MLNPHGDNEKRLRGWLVVFSKSQNNMDYPLYEGKNVIGSSPYANIQVTKEEIESFHFSIRFTEKDTYLTDFDTISGIYIDEKRLYRDVIQDETIFYIGESRFLVKFF